LAVLRASQVWGGQANALPGAQGRGELRDQPTTHSHPATDTQPPPSCRPAQAPQAQARAAPSAARAADRRSSHALRRS
ncbi:hypothetical protein, partial [Streptomyces sp. NPDC001155]